MGKVVRKRKRTVLGWIVRKIEKELTPQKETLISLNVILEDALDSSADAHAIQMRREELKTAISENTDIIILGEDN